MRLVRVRLVVLICIACLFLPLLAETVFSSGDIRGHFLTQAADFLTLPVPRALAVARQDGQVVAWGVMGGAINLQAAKEAATAACEAKIRALGVQAECIVEAVSDDEFATGETVLLASQRRGILDLRAIPKYELLFEDQVKLYTESRGAKALSVAMGGDLVIAWGLRTDEYDLSLAESAARESCQRNVAQRGLVTTCQIVAGEPAENNFPQRSNPSGTTFLVQSQAGADPLKPVDRPRVKPRSQVDSVLGAIEMPVTGSSEFVAIPGHEDIEIRGVRITLGHRRATATLYFYQHSSSDKEVLYTVDIVSRDGEYLGGSTQYLYLDEGEKNTESIGFRLNQKFLDTDGGGMIARVKIHSVRIH